LKTVSDKTGEKAFNYLQRKKSSGKDGLGQDKLIEAKNILKILLTRIINAFIEAGEFPKIWKNVVVTPILKKGERTKKENYRPVSCLSVLSKVLEKIVCHQVTKFMEENDLFPENQQGFRKNWSTMTALTAMQREWMERTEEREKTVILLRDLTATYHTLDADLLCKKLEIYGFCAKTREWFRPFPVGEPNVQKLEPRCPNQ
jgi:hypothetical protein